MDAFPAFFPLAGAKIVIAGSGEGAEAKARLFDGSPARLVRVEDAQAYLPATYAGASLVFIASPDDLFVQAAVTAARSARVPVNVVDRPPLCDFTTPAVIDRGEVVAAVGTGGASPMLATLLRNTIETRIPEGTGRIAALFRRMQDEVREALPELPRRRAFLRQALEGPAADAAVAGNMEAAEALLRKALAEDAPQPGRLQFVAGRGPADLITLRASRALASADVLVIPPDADPEIVGMARRDAERVAPEAATPDHLIDLGRQGLKVVSLITVMPQAEALRAYADSGLAVEVMLAAPQI
ncbi:MAG: precorrin-2 dehydrogenase/sirohydrochlorin ferrochelatase [Pseudoalteromonas distincta]